MPDDPRRGGPSSRGDQDPQNDQPTGRRRRSMEGSGGLSVSDLVERHSRTNIPRPVPPTAQPPQHHQAPPPAPPNAPRPADLPGRVVAHGENTGRRAAPPGEVQSRLNGAPERPQNGVPNADRPRPTPDQNGMPPNAERTGTRPRPEMPRGGEPTGMHPMPSRAESSGPRPRPEHMPPAGERTGSRPRPEVPGAERTGARRRPEPGMPGPELNAERTGSRPRPNPSGMQDSGLHPRPGAPNGMPGPDLNAERTGTRPRPPMPDQNGMPPNAERTGTRPRPAPGDPGLDPNGAPRRLAGEQTGTRPRPPMPDQNGMPPNTERTGTRPRPVPGGDPNGAPQDQGRTRGKVIRKGVDGPEVQVSGMHPVPPHAEPGGATGLHPMPSRAESSGPRPDPRGEATGLHPAPSRAESSGPRPDPRGEATGLHPAPSRAESSGPRPDPREAMSGDPIANRLSGDAEVEAPKPPKREEIDPLSLTTEMEAIGDEVKKRREVDHTLARFSAVHDELLEQERQKKERRAKFMPWRNDDEDGEDATQFAEPPTEFVDPDEGETSPSGRTPQQRKMMRLAKVTAIAAAALVFVSTGVGWAAKLWVDNKFQKIDALGGNSQAVQQAEKQLGDENFLIVGSDTRAGAKAGDNVGTQEQEPGARSDVVMLAHVPKDRKRVVVVSLPRDVEVDIPACEKWDANTGKPTGEKVPPQKGVKANEAYATGGPRCVTDLMTELTGLKINHFVSIDFNGFRNMSTAVGGVEICTSKALVDDELGVVIDKPGKHQLSGDKALQYVRARKVAGEPFGDYDRITRQQQFLSAMLRQALSSEVLLDPTKLNAFINAFAQSTAGDNVGVDQLLTLGQSLQGLEAGRVSFVTMPHFTDDMQLKNIPDDNVERLKPDEVKALFQSIIDGTPLPQEKTDPNSTPDPKAPPKEGSVVAANQVSVQVLNGDAENGGAAGRTRTALEKQGFKVVNVGDSPPAQKTIIKYAKGREDWAATLKAAVPSAEKVEDPSMGGAVVLVLGADFDNNVVAPQAGQSQGQANQAGTPEDLSIVNAATDPCAK